MHPLLALWLVTMNAIVACTVIAVTPYPEVLMSGHRIWPITPTHPSKVPRAG